MTVDPVNGKQAEAKAGGSPSKAAKAPKNASEGFWSASEEYERQNSSKPVYDRDDYTPSYIKRFLLAGPPDMEAILTPTEITALISRYYRYYHREREERADLLG